jgi:hypothetical protein
MQCSSNPPRTRHRHAKLHGFRHGARFKQCSISKSSEIDACVETLGLRSDRLVVEFTQHTPDEMYRAGRGWGTEWSPDEATIKQGAESAR